MKKNHYYFDTHCHLQYMPDPQEALHEAYRMSVNRIMCVSTSLECPPKIKKIIEENKSQVKVDYSVGIHPKDTCTALEAKNYLEHCLKDPNPPLAIGETGLDNYRGCDNLQEQIELFKLHLEFGRKYNLPVIMHLRCGEVSLEEIAQNLIEESGARGIAHCFGGSIDMLRFLANKGWFVSFAGNVTYGIDLHEAVKEIADDKLLIETDAPYLPPEPYRNSQRMKNRPCYLPITFEAICKIRQNTDKQRLMEQIYRNSLNIFGIK